MQERAPHQTITGLAVHVFTASGAAVAFMALAAAVQRDFPAVFAWLALALLIDGVDGALARAVDVEARVPWMDGAVLDLVVDYLTYVFVPIVALWRSDLLPSSWATPLCAVIATASALYFGDRRMKTQDHWFRGFPTLWNVLALYLFVFEPPAWVNAILLLAATALLFAPIVFVHPMRVRRLRRVTVCVTIVWFAFAAMAWDASLHPAWWVKLGLALSGLYVVALPLLRETPWAQG